MPFGEGLVRGEGDAALLLTFGQDLDEEFGDEQGSVMVTSNLPFGRWGETFSDDVVKDRAGRD